MTYLYYLPDALYMSEKQRYDQDCLGNKTGKELSKNFWIPNEGPLDVPVRFSNSDDLGKFFSKFNRYEFEIISRELYLGGKIVEYCIEIQK